MYFLQALFSLSTMFTRIFFMAIFCNNFQFSCCDVVVVFSPHIMYFIPFASTLRLYVLKISLWLLALKMSLCRRFIFFCPRFYFLSIIRWYFISLVYSRRSMHYFHDILKFKCLLYSLFSLVVLCWICEMVFAFGIVNQFTYLCNTKMLSSKLPRSIWKTSISIANIASFFPRNFPHIYRWRTSFLLSLPLDFIRWWMIA